MNQHRLAEVIDVVPKITEREIGRLKVDHRYQRPKDSQRIQRMADHYRPAEVGVLKVSHRDVDEEYLIDGQHRHGMLLLRHPPNWRCRCEVYEGLSLAEEAALFVSLHEGTKATRAYDRYHALIVAGDKQVLEIEEVLGSLDLKAIDARDAEPRGIKSVKNLMEIEEQHGPEMLERVLQILITAWPDTVTNATTGILLTAATSFIATHSSRGKVVNDEAMAQALAKRAPHLWASDAMAARGTLGAYQHLATRLNMRYNTIARTRDKLPELEPGQYRKRPRRSPVLETEPEPKPEQTRARRSALQQARRRTA